MRVSRNNDAIFFSTGLTINNKAWGIVDRIVFPANFGVFHVFVPLPPLIGQPTLGTVPSTSQELTAVDWTSVTLSPGLLHCSLVPITTRHPT
jgi:hypothetical protein